MHCRSAEKPVVNWNTLCLGFGPRLEQGQVDCTLGGGLQESV